MSKQKQLEADIYKYVKSIGAVYESEVLTKFSDSEDIRNMGPVYIAVDNLFRRGKIGYKQNKGQVLVDLHRGTSQ